MNTYWVVIAIRSPRGIEYYTASDVFSGLHTGPYKTEKEAWDWIDALKEEV